MKCIKDAANRGAHRAHLPFIMLLSGLALPLALPAQTVPASTDVQDQPTNTLVPPTTASDFTGSQLDVVLKGNWRASGNRARDVYRHPKDTLQLFGIRPDQTVIEITPGGGWYSEILAPLLHDNGNYVTAVEAPASSGEARKASDFLRSKFAGDVAHYGHVRIVEFDPKVPVFGAPATADLVLTFRNVHNWAAAGTASGMFRGFFAALKPGGVLGVVDHRADDGSPWTAAVKSGYLPTAYVVKLATDAGFTLEQSSELNANLKDTKNYPQGVWTLPPTLALSNKDKETYLAIGESDRMTLRFTKPPAKAATSSVF